MIGSCPHCAFPCDTLPVLCADTQWEAAELNFPFCLCPVPGAGFLGVPVWWQHGSETGNRLQDDASAAEHTGAVGSMAGQCDDAGAEALWRKTQLPKSCQTVSAQMVFLQVASQAHCIFFLSCKCVCARYSQKKRNELSLGGISNSMTCCIETKQENYKNELFAERGDPLALKAKKFSDSNLWESI